MIAKGLRRLSPTPPPKTIGSTGSTQGETTVTIPASRASGTATTSIRPLFGRVCLLGCYRSLIFVGSLLRLGVRSSSATALLASAPAARATRGLGLGQVFGQGGGDLLNRPELFAGLVEQL